MTKPEKLEAENKRLNEIIAGAATILTLYDGGKFQDKDELVDIIYKARDVLHDANKEGHNHQYILEIFKNWLELECSSCKQKKQDVEKVHWALQKHLK